MVALAPSQVFATSAAVGEVLATVLFLTILIASFVVSRRKSTSAGPLLAIGLLVGYAALVKDFALALVAIPVLCAWSVGTPWRRSLRHGATVLLGAAVLLVPWGVRNAVQVGWWSPTSTVVADGLCITAVNPDHQFVDDVGPNVPTDIVERCYRNSPLDDAGGEFASLFPDDYMFGRPDEGPWARRHNREFLSWVLDHPTELLAAAPMKLYYAVGNDSSGGILFATQSGEARIASTQTLGIYNDLANAWYYVVTALAIAGLAMSPSVRRAVPVWAIVVLVATYPVLGPRTLSRHFFIAQPLLAVLAAGTVAAMSFRDRQSSP